ncbi:DUF4079 domain-containing protein [Gloeocapsopsis crepidinum LEGE 06123]|uniref:DUF4079 domain-containing protein n=1 Tax=Gloeocapsopsis crepidinum LEGE 06123 TaxID=588587 RepID=A0ABR9UX53_9CHRO|nr:DUF4079 domain-containing protein [Gloeocapsopsis crepidinum]MBE9192861.1 DUF4079 domain-containing protein [Gloeocapsopsis crepidinum LEGE 06123]
MEVTNTINFLSFGFLIQFIHPVIMLGLFAYLLYTGYLGFQVRRTRNTQGDIKKELIQGKYPLRHYQSGAIALAVMVIGAVGGIMITYLSAGKIPVNSHLFVGLGMTALVALSAAFAPLMQRGNNWARYLHITINITLLAFFAWQSMTGLQIVQELLTIS